MSDPLSGSRRSGRQRVFNTRFKDMEVQITPKRQAGKTTSKPSDDLDAAASTKKKTTPKANSKPKTAKNTTTTTPKSKLKANKGNKTGEVKGEVKSEPEPVSRKTKSPRKPSDQMADSSDTGTYMYEECDPKFTSGRKRKSNHNLWLNKPKHHKTSEPCAAPASDHSQYSMKSSEVTDTEIIHVPAPLGSQINKYKNSLATKKLHSATQSVMLAGKPEVKSQERARKPAVRSRKKAGEQKEPKNPVLEVPRPVRRVCSDVVGSRTDGENDHGIWITGNASSAQGISDDTLPKFQRDLRKERFSFSRGGSDDNEAVINVTDCSSPQTPVYLLSLGQTDKSNTTNILNSGNNVDIENYQTPFVKYGSVDAGHMIPGSVDAGHMIPGSVDAGHMIPGSEKPGAYKQTSDCIVRAAATMNTDKSMDTYDVIARSGPDVYTTVERLLAETTESDTSNILHLSGDNCVSGDNPVMADLSAVLLADNDQQGEPVFHQVESFSVEQVTLKGESLPVSQVFVDMDTGEHSFKSRGSETENEATGDMTGEQSNSPQEQSNQGDNGPGDKSKEAGEQSKEQDEYEKEHARVKVMEAEMMSLLNLFIADADQKKKNNHSSLPENNEDEISTSEAEGAVLSSATDGQLTEDVDSHTYVGVEVIDISEVDMKDLVAQTKAKGSVKTVFLGDETPVKSAKVSNGEGEVGDNMVSCVSTVDGKATTDNKMTEAIGKDGKKHYVVKAAKYKIEVNSDGESICSRCQCKVDDDPENSKHSCRLRSDDLLRMSDDGNFCCTKCDYSTEKKINWYKHKIRHQERRYQCSKCQYKASTSSNLKRHLMSHDDVRNFGCKICWATFPQKIHLQRHIKYKHQPHNIQCSYCDYVCAEVQPDLVVHMKRKHPELCNLDKEGNPIKTGEGALDVYMRYKCDHCSLYAVNRKDLQQHMKFHKKGSELKFFCELCSFVTECESRLKRHMLTHTKEKPYGCSMCTYRGSLPEHVKRHLKTRHKIDLHYSKRKNPRTKKPEVTDDDGLNNLLDIKVKKPTHSDTRNSEKHFACNFCTMKFSKLISLFKHVHVQHSQMLPPDHNYSCVVCDYSTTHYKRLLLHMRKMHSTANCLNAPQKQEYVCISCSYSTPYRLFLHAHMKREHDMQFVTDKFLTNASRHSSTVSAGNESDPQKPGSIITHPIEEPGAATQNPSKESKMVLLQLTPDGPMTPVVINMDSESSTSKEFVNAMGAVYPVMETGVTEQAAPTTMECEVIFDNDLSQVLQNSTVTTDTVAMTTDTTGNTAVTTDGTCVAVRDVSEMIQDIMTESSQDSSLLSSDGSPRDTSDITPNSHVKTEADSQNTSQDGNTSVKSPVGNTTAESPVKNTGSESGDEESEHVVHLSSGDYVEINGQIYQIEMEDNEER